MKMVKFIRISSFVFMMVTVLVCGWLFHFSAYGHEYKNDNEKALAQVLKTHLADESEAVKNGLWLRYRVSHSKPGDIIELEPGRYTLKVPSIYNVDRFFHYEGDIIDLKINHDLTIRGKSENPQDVIIDWETSRSAEKVAKGLFVTRQLKHKQKGFPESIALTVENLTFENAVGYSNNGAGVRVQGTRLTVKNCRFINNQNGILFTSAIEAEVPDANYYEGELIVENSYFESNGEDISQLAHGIYMSRGSSLIVRDTRFVDTKRNGHHIKSLARMTHVTGSSFSNKNAEITYNIDTPNGGNVVIENNQFDYYEAQDGEDNRSMFLYGSIQRQNKKEKAPLGRYVFRHNKINNYHPNARFLVKREGIGAYVEACGNEVNTYAGKELKIDTQSLTKSCGSQ